MKQISTQIIFLLCLAFAVLVAGFVIAIIYVNYLFVSRTTMGLGILFTVCMAVPAIMLINRHTKQNEDRITKLEQEIELLKTNSLK